MEERRKAPRARAYLPARVVFNSKNSTKDCLVRNLTEEGARIVFEDSKAIPEEFEFLIPTKQDHRQARMVWRHGSDAGVLFLEKFASPAPKTRAVEDEGW